MVGAERFAGIRIKFFMRWALIPLLAFAFLVWDISKNHGQYTRSISASLEDVWREIRWR